ncbi:MAG TPA: FMN-binding protein [Streptosporangiaceae bacterium]|nr:FMN-binding protein [Streptosporangiaceae bacterium]
MKRAAWYLVAGAVAGFAGVAGLHSRTPAPAARAAAGGATGHTQPGQPGPSGQPAKGGAAHSANGATEQYGYGELAVRVTVSGNRITNVTVPSLQTAEPYSQQLAQQVIPMLRSQVLAAGGASINGVSGATYTSEAYATSVQAALDKLHLK